MKGAITFVTAMTMTEDVSYGIYTIERLPKGSRRTPKWDLHSIAKDRPTAETHARTLAAQPYFDSIEIQEFRVCPQTNVRRVHKIRTYSRRVRTRIGVAAGLAALTLLFLGMAVFA